MSKYFEVLIDGKFLKSFSGSKEKEAIELYDSTREKNPDSLIKIVLHRRTDVRVSRHGINNIRSKNL